VTTDPAPATIRSASVRARWLIRLLVASGVVSAAGIVVSLYGWWAIGTYLDHQAARSVVDAFEIVDGLVALIGIIVAVATIVAWLAWQSRTIDNEAGLGIGPSSVSPRRSIGWWFVPFANVWMPYDIHREIYRCYLQEDAVDVSAVKLWWALVLVSVVTDRIASRVRSSSLSETQESLIFWILADIVSIASVVAAVGLIRRIQAAADRLASGHADLAAARWTATV
jgi:hypothetical protein